VNYFQLFGFDNQFNINTKALAQTYQNIQRAVHPDRFAHGSEQEKLLAVKKSTLINDAYQTLKNPIKRAEYMLVLRNVDMPNEQVSFSDNSFLKRQIELREMLAEVKHADDIDAVVNEVTQVFEAEFEQLFKAMQTQLNENTESANTLACENLRKLKFYQKLHVELDKLEDLLFDD